MPSYDAYAAEAPADQPWYLDAWDALKDGFGWVAGAVEDIGSFTTKLGDLLGRGDSRGRSNTNVLTQTPVFGIPNWVWLVGAGVVVLVLVTRR